VSATTRRWLIGLALVVNLGLGASYAGLWIRDARNHALWRADFTAFYTGATMIAEGEGAELYDFAAQARAQQRLLGERRFERGLLPFLNPPHVAFALVPLTRLSLAHALWIWTAAQLGVALWLGSLLWRRADTSQERALVLSAVLAAPPLFQSLELGAFSVLVALAWIKARDALAARRDAAAGLWVAVGLVKPHLVLLLAVALLAARRWRALAALGALALAFTAGPALALGWGVWPAFARAALHTGLNPDTMYNLEGALLLLGVHGARAIALLGLAAAAGGVIWLWLAVEASLDGKLAITALLAMLTSLHLYAQDGLLLVVAALFFHWHVRGAPSPRFAAVALASPGLWFLAERALTSRLPLRFPVLLALALGALFVGEWAVAARGARDR
jgi:hypothetical protein